MCDLSQPDALRVHQSAFLLALPRMRAVISYRLRGVYPADRREELQAEAIALAWGRWVALARRGRAPADLAGGIARRAAGHVLAGRRLAGAEPAGDVASYRLRYRGISCEPLGVEPSALDDLGHDDGRWEGPDLPPDDLVASRLDYATFMASLPTRLYAVASDLAEGTAAGDVAEDLGISPTRVSQLRAELRMRWERLTR